MLTDLKFQRRHHLLIAIVTLTLTLTLTTHIGLSAHAAENSLQPKIRSLENSSPERILFVGNSYFYYNDSLHNHVTRLVAASDSATVEQTTYKSATIGGASLDQHDIGSLLQPGRLGIDESFDLVILQGGSSEPLSERRRIAFAATASEFQPIIESAGAETALYMTHAYAEPHRRYDPEMIRDIESLYVETAKQIGALVIPVGLAFEEAYRLRPDIKLHKSFDGSHPDMLGTYLAACVVFASVYGLSPVDNSYDYFGAVGPEDAAFLQGVARTTVMNFLNIEL